MSEQQDDQTHRGEPENIGEVVRSPKTRKWLYGILAAAVPLVVAAGVISENEATLWVALGAAVLGTGGHALAAKNTPKE